MVSKTIKIKLNVSNKLLYSVLAIILVIGISAIVYAYNPSGTGGIPSVFGHSADEIEGLGSNNIDMYVDTTTKKLCYQNGTITSGCITQQLTCTAPPLAKSFSDEGLCASFHTTTQRLEYCKEQCGTISISSPCYGDNTALNNCGAYPTSVTKFNNATYTSCTPNTGSGGVDTISCTCKLTSATYIKEISNTGTTPTYRCL